MDYRVKPGNDEWDAGTLIRSVFVASPPAAPRKDASDRSEPVPV